MSFERLTYGMGGGILRIGDGRWGMAEPPLNMGGGPSGRPWGTLRLSGVTLKLGRATWGLRGETLGLSGPAMGLVGPTVELNGPTLELIAPKLGTGCSAEPVRPVLRDGGGKLVLGGGTLGIKKESFGLGGDTFKMRGTIGTGGESFGGTFALGGGTLRIGGGTLNGCSPCPPGGDGLGCQRCQRLPHCGGGSARLGPGGGPLNCARELGW